MTISFLRAVGIGQLAHLDRVIAGDDGGGLQHEATGGAAADETGFGAGDAGEFATGGTVEVVDVDHDPGSPGHELKGLGAGASAAEAGDGTRGVDDGRDADALIQGVYVKSGSAVGHGFLLRRDASSWVLTARYYINIKYEGGVW